MSRHVVGGLGQVQAPHLVVRFSSHGVVPVGVCLLENVQHQV